MFTQAKQPHYCFYDSWTDPSDRLDNPPCVVVLHNTISSVYKEKRLKACYQHFTRGPSWLINGASAVHFLCQQSLNFWLDDVTSTVKKRNCDSSEAVFKLQLSFSSSI